MKKYLGLILLLSLLSGSAHAGFFGCDEGTEDSYCSGSQLKDSVKKAISVGVMNAMKRNLKTYHRGYCDENINMSTSTKCLVSSEVTDMFVSAEVNKEAFKDKSVKCELDTRQLFRSALNSKVIPRFDSHTGEERPLALGELILLMQQYGDQVCAED